MLSCIVYISSASPFLTRAIVLPNRFATPQTSFFLVTSSFAGGNTEPSLNHDEWIAYKIVKVVFLKIRPSPEVHPSVCRIPLQPLHRGIPFTASSFREEEPDPWCGERGILAYPPARRKGGEWVCWRCNSGADFRNDDGAELQTDHLTRHTT